MTATHAQMRVTMRCACGNRERIFVTRHMQAAWMHKRYVCDDCKPTLDRIEHEADLEKLQREPVTGALAGAM